MGQRAAIYARVSTADQLCERQLRDLAGFADRGGYEVVGMFRDTASGMKANSTARAEIMKLAQARHIDAILVTELSRWAGDCYGRAEAEYRRLIGPFGKSAIVASVSVGNGASPPS